MIQSQIKVGIAKQDITPPLNLPMAGYGSRLGYSTGVADPLYTRAFSLYDEAQNKRIAILTADLVAFDPETLRVFREKVLAETGISSDDVIVAVTHTHSGPAYGNFYDFYKASSMEKEAEASLAWGKSLPDRLIGVLKAAIDTERYARIRLSNTQVSLSVHRRYRDPSGDIRLAPNVAGLTDPNVGILQAIDNDTGQPLGTLLNYACHPVVLCEDNLLYSGDYPAYALQLLEEETGAPAIFVNGLCGNINPAARGDLETAKMLGHNLANSVLEALGNSTASPLSELSLQSRSEIVKLPLKHSNSTQFEDYVNAADHEYARHSNPDNFEGKRLYEEVSRAKTMLDRHLRLHKRFQALIDDEGKLQARIQVVKLGPTVLLALPGETFVEFSLELRKQTSLNPLFLFGYSHESIGYVPTEKAYPEGGYEVNVSYLAPGAGEQLFREVQLLLKDLNFISSEI